ncbi:MAG: sulfite exporter TauE/SafE family protein [Candidatus Acidiferrales bacterium]
MAEIILGLFGGILVGATGSGFGTVITPILLLLGYSPAVAIGTMLGVLVATKFVGAITHQQLGHWPRQHVWLLLAGGVGGALVSGFAATSWMPTLPGGNRLLERFVGAALLGLATFIIGQELLKRYGKEPIVSDNIVPRERGGPMTLFAVGMGTGMAVTLTSAGSGSVLVPALALVTNWSTAQLAAASNLFGWVVGVIGVVLFSHAGAFAWPLFAKVLIGTLPGIYLGALVSRRITRQWLLRAVAAIAVVLGARLIFR